MLWSTGSEMPLLLNIDAVSKKNYCFVFKWKIYITKKDHSYYYQCQIQMLVTSRQYCDFVVWAEDDSLHIRTIKLERLFIDQIEKAEELFWLVIEPELL